MPTIAIVVHVVPLAITSAVSTMPSATLQVPCSSPRPCQARAERPVARIERHVGVLEAQPMPGQPEPGLVDRFLGAEERAVQLQLADVLAQPGTLGGGGHDLQDTRRQRRVDLGVDADRAVVGDVGHGGGPVARQWVMLPTTPVGHSGSP